MESLRCAASSPLCTQRLACLESLGDRRPWHSSVLGLYSLGCIRFWGAAMTLSWEASVSPFFL